MIVNYYKLNQEVAPDTTVVFLLEQINTSVGPWHEVLDLAKAFFSILLREQVQKQLVFTCNGRRAYIYSLVLELC